MSMTIHVPADVEEVFRQTWGEGLDRAALEALVIQGYRHRKFGISMVRRLLGFDSRGEAEQWLGRQGVNWNYSTDDLDSDLNTLSRVLGSGTR